MFHGVRLLSCRVPEPHFVKISASAPSPYRTATFLLHFTVPPKRPASAVTSRV